MINYYLAFKFMRSIKEWVKLVFSFLSMKQKILILYWLYGVFFQDGLKYLPKILGLPVLILKYFLLTQIIPRNQNIMLIRNSLSVSVGLLQYGKWLCIQEYWQTLKLSNENSSFLSQMVKCFKGEKDWVGKSSVDFWQIVIPSKWYYKWSRCQKRK